MKSWLLIVFSIISSAICLYLHTDSCVPYYIIPIVYSVCNCFRWGYVKYSRQISILIIEGLMIVRYMLTPISYYLLGTTPDAMDNRYAFEGITLMIYEMVIVFACLNYFPRKIFKQSSNVKKNRNTDIKASDIGIQLLVVLFLITLASYPQYVKNLLTFSFENMETVEVESEVNGMFNIIYKSGSIAISCILLSTYKNNNGSALSLIRCLLVSWLCTWLCSLGTSGMVSRTSFLTNGIIFTLMVINYYPRYKKTIVTTSTSIVLLMLIFGTIARFYSGDTSGVIFFNDMLGFELLDSYFGGLRDVIVSIKTEIKYGQILGLETFFNDLFAGVPYFASRSGMDFDLRSPYFFNATFFGFEGIISRIIPMIGQGYCYFGPLLAPLPTAISVYAAIKLNKKMNDSSNLLSFYMYCLMMYYFSAYSMYNMNIIAGGFWNKILPILLAVWLNNITKKIKR